MGIIYNGEGIRNHVTDTFNNYNGKINIETRGSSSQWFDKKSYNFETQTATGLNNNVSLIDLPVENDWVLYGPYSDKSLIRNYLSYNLSAKTGTYAPRTKFCELLLNNEYQGVYMLTEKIKRDTNRIDIADLNPQDTSGNELTGGYIMKIDKFTGSTGESFSSSYPPYDGAWQDVIIQYHDPGSGELQAIQKFYIKNYILSFERDLYEADPNDLSVIYNKYIHIDSFIDFLIINEVAKNIDGYRLSTFFYKDKFSRDRGRIRMGPVWDFNLSFGNGNYYEGWETSGWQFDFRYVGEGDGYQIPFWWEKLLLNDLFQDKLKTRWINLRQSFLHTDSVLNYVDEQAALLAEAQERNFQKWQILGTYVWPNYFIASTYEEEIAFMKDWITDRLIWIDGNIPGNYVSRETKLPEKLHVMYPNPASDYLKIYGLNDASIIISDIRGRTLYKRTGLYGELRIELNDMQSGIYILNIFEGTYKETHKLIIQH
jgi:hypothetical protein